MNRFIVFIATLSLYGSISAADEYLIRVDVVGYEDVVVTEKVPEETVLGSIKVIGKPHEPFRRTVQMGRKTLTLEGTLQPQSDGRLILKVGHCRTIDTGSTVPAADGTEEPVLDRMECRAMIFVKLGRPTLFGGVESNTQEIVAGQIRNVESKLHHVVVVRKRVGT